jgi:pimeloyl-ACP methyl ester carboxylesterase
MSGRATALIHGLGSSYEHGWERAGWPALLADLGRTAVPVALPGHPGAADRLVEGDAVDAVAAQLPEGEVDLVAFSAGALIALALLARRPERIGTAVLLGIGDGILQPGGAPDLGAPVWQRLLASSGATAEGVDALLAVLPPVPDDTARSAIATSCVFVTGELDPVGAPTRLAAPIPRAVVRVIPRVDHFGLPGNPRVMAEVMDMLAG